MIYGCFEKFINQERPIYQRYLVASVLAALLLGVDASVPYHPNAALFATCLAMLSILFTAMYGGVGPGMVVGLLGTLAIDYYFVQPIGAVLSSSGDFLFLAGFLCVALTISLMASFLKRAYQSALQAKKSAQRATRAREEILAIVSHDLRNSLSTVSLISKLLPERIDEGGALSVAKELAIMDRGLGQMNRLIQDLLDASKIDSRTFAVQLRETNVECLVQDVAESIRGQAEQREISLDVTFDGKIPLVKADPDRICQAILNLVGNAIKFTPRKGKIQVLGRAVDGNVQLSVRDSGPGIPEADQPKVFISRWQAKNSAQMGAGLGLFIVHGIVRAHGGRIWLDSKPGAGSTFSFTLPAVSSA